MSKKRVMLLMGVVLFLFGSFLYSFANEGKYQLFTINETMKMDLPIDVSLKFFHSSFDEHNLLGNISARNVLDEPVYIRVYIALLDDNKDLIAAGQLLGSKNLPLDAGAGQYSVSSIDFGINEKSAQEIQFFLVKINIYDINGVKINDLN